MEPNTNRPTPDIRIKEITVFVDPFEDFLAQKRAEEARATGVTGPSTEEADETARRAEDDRVTWTGKRVRGGEVDSTDDGASGIGKYLKAGLADQDGQGEDEILEFLDEKVAPEPARKKAKGPGGFGDFSSW